MSNVQTTTAELVPIREYEGKQAVSGRELHEFLQVETAYNVWFGRMLAYGFDEDKDFQSFLIESTGGRPSADHALTLDMAKELSMIQRTDRGKQARQYFIEVEKKAQAALPLVPQSLPDALRAYALEVEQRQALEQKIVADEPKVDYVDTFVADNDVRLLRFVAQQLDLTESFLRNDLVERGWIYREHQRRRNSKGEVVDEFRYSAYSHKAKYFDPVPNHQAPLFKGNLMHTLKVTPQGAVAIARLYGKHLTAVEAVES